MNLNDLKKALDSGDKFIGTDKFNEIIKKAHDVVEKGNIGEVEQKLNKRLTEEWNAATPEQISAEIKDSRVRMEKREVAQKNEMELAKIKFLENEIKAYESFGEEIQKEMDLNQATIDELKKEIESIKKSIS